MNAALTTLMATAVSLPVAFSSPSAVVMTAQVAPETYAQRQCPRGQVWDQRRKRCVSQPRGSY